MSRTTRLLSFAIAVFVAQAIVRADDGTIRITVARANVRAAASDTAPVVTQVTAGTVLPLKAIEGDWYRVQLPPDPRAGGARAEAFVSKRVAAVMTPPTPASPSAATPSGPISIGGPRPEVPPPPITMMDGMSVSVQLPTGASYLSPGAARYEAFETKADALSAVAPLVQEKEDLSTPAPDAQVTFVWSTAGGESARVLETRRPAFLVLFKEVPGIRPEDLTPVLLRLTPSPSGRLVIAAVRARADVARQTDPEWNLSKDLRQDVVKARVDVVEPGAVKLQPNGDLEPGAYAVVLRFSGNKKVAGASVLSKSGAGRLFGAVWTFTIK